MYNPPRNRNPDLEAPLVDSASLDESGFINDAGPERRPSYIVRENLLREMQMRIYGSIIFCISSTTLSVFKLIISNALLAYDKSQCNQPLDDYFVYMSVHDIINCMVLTLRLTTIIAIYGRRSLDNEGRPVLFIDNLTHERISRYKWRLRVIAIVFGFNNLFYCLLFVYAHFIYFQSQSNCSELAPLKNGVMLSYIIIGYISIGLPTISFLLVCFCLPCLLLGFYFTKKRRNHADKKLINSLPVTKYSPDLPGDKECSICMTEYVTDDKIVQLKCSAFHYFHEDCIKKWLMINKHCPICRQPIDKDESQELQPMPQNNNMPEDMNDLEANGPMMYAANAPLRQRRPEPEDPRRLS